MDPDGLAYDIERTSVRVVLLDAGGRLLLFRTVDPSAPALGTWWELPGGGMEAGESVAQTAARELAEETGIVLPESVVAALAARGNDPTWTRTATYVRRGRRILQHELVVAVRIDAVAPEPAREGRTPEELEDYVGHRWWTVDEVAGSGERFFPGRLPTLLERFLAGERIDEPFERWN